MLLNQEYVVVYCVSLVVNELVFDSKTTSWTLREIRYYPRAHDIRT